MGGWVGPGGGVLQQVGASVNDADATYLISRPCILFFHKS